MSPPPEIKKGLDPVGRPDPQEAGVKKNVKRLSGKRKACLFEKGTPRRVGVTGEKKDQKGVATVT